MNNLEMDKLGITKSSNFQNEKAAKIIFIDEESPPKVSKKSNFDDEKQRADDVELNQKNLRRIGELEKAIG